MPKFLDKLQDKRYQNKPSSLSATQLMTYIIWAVPENENPRGGVVGGQHFSDPSTPMTKTETPPPDKSTDQNPILWTKNNIGVKTYNLCKRVESIMQVQPMPHGSPVSHAVSFLANVKLVKHRLTFFIQRLQTFFLFLSCCYVFI